MSESEISKSDSSKKPDDLARDLRDIFDRNIEHQQLNEFTLMQDLTIFITSRDGKVFNHGLEVGKNNVTRNNNTYGLPDGPILGPGDQRSPAAPQPVL